MNRLPVAVAAAMLALPASAAAAPTRGVVLSVNAGRHTIQVVDGKHQAHGYRYRGSLPRLHPGSRISFARRGHTIAGVRVAPGKTVSFYGRVVRSNAGGLTLRLGDGATVSFSANQVSAVRQRVNSQWHRWRSLSAAAPPRPHRPEHRRARPRHDRLRHRDDLRRPRHDLRHAAGRVTRQPERRPGREPDGEPVKRQRQRQRRRQRRRRGGDHHSAVNDRTDDQRRRPHDDLQL